jgi:hypothetical protein
VWCLAVDRPQYSGVGQAVGETDSRIDAWIRCTAQVWTTLAGRVGLVASESR